MGLIRRLRITQRAMEIAMLGVSLRDQIRNEEIRRRNQSYRHNSASCKAEVEIGGAHSSNRWTLRFQGDGTWTKANEYLMRKTSSIKEFNY
ncbi:jg19260 [Pararge aegeria aegeria]|uniref:Jg19260 protein n=1 Tax=Pararge aegeria aegeria TaxID=348720 RepID=A0A8S4S675_9NEOP|nr:jg19260 [Pararge aegeria aegeria]